MLLLSDRLLQGQFPRHTLVKRSSQPAETAFSAFNPPKEAAGTSASSPESRGNTPPLHSKADSLGCKMTSTDSSLLFCCFRSVSSSLVLRASQSSAPSPDPPPLESRIKQDKSDFELKERQRVAQEVRAEKKQKKQVDTGQMTTVYCIIHQRRGGTSLTLVFLLSGA